MMKPNKSILGVESYQYKLKGGPLDGQKYRLDKTPMQLRFPVVGPNGWGHYIYRLTYDPERKRWPYMYIYDEVMSYDQDCTSDVRARRAERLANSIRYGTPLFHHRYYRDLGAAKRKRTRAPKQAAETGK